MNRRQAEHAILFVALLPAGDGRGEGSQLLTNLAVGTAFIQKKNDPHSLGDAGRKVPFPQVGLDLASFAGGQVQYSHLRHKYMANKNRYPLLRDTPLDGRSFPKKLLYL